MQRRPTLSFLAALALLLAAGATAAAERVEERFEQTYAFAPGARLGVSNTNGDIVVESWDRAEAHVEAVKRVRSRGGDAQAALDALRIEIDTSGGDLEIDTEYPNWRRLFGWNEVNAAVDYRIRVPREARVELRTVNGEIEISEMSGELRLRSTNGGIAVLDSAGRVDAHTTNGGIQVELRSVLPGSDMEFQTTNGGIRLYLPSDIQASLDARTTNGSIETDFPVQVQGTFRRNRLEGDINGGGPVIELQTTNGSIRIRER